MVENGLNANFFGSLTYCNAAVPVLCDRRLYCPATGSTLQLPVVKYIYFRFRDTHVLQRIE